MSGLADRSPVDISAPVLDFICAHSDHTDEIATLI